MTDLHTAERSVTERRDLVAGRLAGLRARIAELAGRRSEAIRGGEYVSAEVLHAEQAEVEREHDLLSRHAGELDEAAGEAMRSRQRQDWLEQRAEAVTARDQHLRTAAQQADRLTALMAEAVEVVRQGAAAERAAKDAQSVVAQTTEALDPLPPVGGQQPVRPPAPVPQPMARLVNGDRVLHELFSKYL